MVHVRIGKEDRDLRDVTSTWLRAGIERLRHLNEPVCVRVSINSGIIDMVLATSDCPTGNSDEFRPYRGVEIKIFHDWQAKRLDTVAFSVGELEDFLKSLRKFQP